MLSHAQHVRPDALLHCTGSRAAALSLGEHDAGGQSLHIPLPGTGLGLVKIIHIEDLVALRRSIGSEVGNMRIAAGLYLDTRQREVTTIRQEALILPPVAF
jgi:hypothetical protein